MEDEIVIRTVVNLLSLYGVLNTRQICTYYNKKNLDICRRDGKQSQYRRCKEVGCKPNYFYFMTLMPRLAQEVVVKRTKGRFLDLIADHLKFTRTRRTDLFSWYYLKEATFQELILAPTLWRFLQ